MNKMKFEIFGEFFFWHISQHFRTSWLKKLSITSIYLFIYLLNLFIYLSAFMTFDSVPESHTYKYSTFQAQNPGRFLSCMRKEMALLTFSLPAGIIVRGYEDRVVILCLFCNFFLSFSVRAAAYFSRLELQRWRPKLCETRERFSSIEIPKHKCRFVWFNTRPLIGQKVSCHFLSQSEHQPKINTC